MNQVKKEIVRLLEAKSNVVQIGYEGNRVRSYVI